MDFVTLHRTGGPLTRRAFLGAAALISQTACGQETVAVGGARFRIVNSPVTSTTNHAGSTRRYIHIHGNESTAREVLGAHLIKHAGIAFFVEGDERTVLTEGLEIDPNRMFSRVGAEANLRRLNPAAADSAVERAVARIERELPALLGRLLPPPGGLLIAVHNNSQGYSIEAEIPISDAHHLPKPAEPNDFFLATNEADFEALRKSPYNAVLQAKAPPTDDDGSLSRLCAARRIRYVNLECFLGRADKQGEMLAWLDVAMV